MKRILPFGIFLFGAQAVASSSPALQLQPGFVYKLKCQGRLLVSAVGSDTLLQLEALPKELGCGALLKPLAASGRSNIILETSTGTIVRSVEIAHRTSPPTLELELGKGVQQ